MGVTGEKQTGEYEISIVGDAWKLNSGKCLAGA